MSGRNHVFQVNIEDNFQSQKQFFISKHNLEFQYHPRMLASTWNLKIPVAAFLMKS